MAKYCYIFILIVVSVCIADVKTTPCDCSNPIYIDIPNNRNLCDGQAKDFYTDILVENYAKFKKAFANNVECKTDNLSGLVALTNQMATSGATIVDAFFNSRDCDATKAVEAAIKADKHVRGKWTAYGRCGFSNLSEKCNQKLQDFRQLIYAAADNIKNSMLTCAKLKAKNCQSGSAKWGFSIPTTSNPNECTCLKITYPPVPQGQQECFSKLYTTKLTKWVSDNFVEIDRAYNAKIGCDYIQLKKQLADTKVAGTTILGLLSSGKSSFKDLTNAVTNYSRVKDAFNAGNTKLVVNNPKSSCYLNLRKVRQNPMRIIDNIVGIVTKCIGHVDKSEKKCTAH